MKSAIRTVFLISCLAAGQAQAQEADPLRADRLATDEEIAFVIPGSEGRPDSDSVASSPIRSLVSDDYSDLAFLREALEGVRIVQLGESGHGMGETALLKSRLVRFLHDELGFGVLAMESDLYQCADADRGADRLDATTTIYKCAFGVWHVEEVVPLFEHLRASRATSNALHLAGFDVQPIGRNKDHRPAYLADLLGRLDADLAAEARTTDSTFLARYEDTSANRRAYLRANREPLIDAYARFAAAIDRVVLSVPVDGDSTSAALRQRALIGAQTARSVVAYVRQQTATDEAGYARARNLGMAENVRWLADVLFPGQKLIVWGHNTHIRHASEAIPTNPEGGPRARARDMGSWLRDWFGDELYTVGVYAYRGSAVNNAREVYEVPEATPAQLESRLAAAAGTRLALFDLGRQGSWVSRGQTLRYNGLFDQVMIPSAQYDALLLIVDVSPPVFLY